MENEGHEVSPELARREAMRAAKGRIDRVNEWLQLGAALPVEEYERLPQAGITQVVELREEDLDDAERIEALGLAWYHVPVPDQGAPTIAQLVELGTRLESPHKECVYVHCGGGFGRAATMAVGLLLLEGVPLDTAIEQVRHARPEIRINPKQLSWLRDVAASLLVAE